MVLAHQATVARAVAPLEVLEMARNWGVPVLPVPAVQVAEEVAAPEPRGVGMLAVLAASSAVAAVVDTMAGEEVDPRPEMSVAAVADRVTCQPVAPR